jgi:Na+-driven multidrug efflux pump
MIFSSYALFAKKTGKLAIVTLSSGFINLVLLFFLIDFLGIKGAAISFVIAKVIQVVGTWFIACSSIKMPWLLFRAKS